VQSNLRNLSVYQNLSIAAAYRPIRELLQYEEQEVSTFEEGNSVACLVLYHHHSYVELVCYSLVNT